MTGSLHGHPEDFPPVGDGGCCLGELMDGPRRCTCWVPVYDLAQQPPRTELAPTARDRLCSDCAYRAGSPEKHGDPRHAADADDLDDIATSGQFFCHVGVRRIMLWRHPAGVEISGHPAGYDPPVIHGVPYRADGTPAERCAGHTARQAALTRANDRAQSLGPSARTQR